MITDKYMAGEALSYGFTYVARDKNQCLFFYENKPEKYYKREAWDSEEGEATMVISFFLDKIGDSDDDKIFKMVKWEDEEPTKLVNIVLVEPEEKKKSIREEKREGSTKVTIKLQQNILVNEGISVYTLLHIAYAKGYRQIVRDEDNELKFYTDCTLERIVDSTNLMVQKGRWKADDSENYNGIRVIDIEALLGANYYIIEDGGEIDNPNTLLGFVKWTDLEPTKIADLIF